MAKKITIEFVKEESLKLGIKILDTEYISAKSLMSVQCGKGHVTSKSWDGIRAGRGCLECSCKKKKTFNEVKEIFSAEGYVVKSDRYTRVHEKLKVVCCKGHEIEISTDKFLRGRRCGKCSGNQKKELREVQKLFSKEGYSVVSKEYIGAHEKMKVICSEGHEINMSSDKFIQGRRCAICRNLNNRGENHPNWNPVLTDDERISRRDLNENKIWRKSVFERDNYTCKKCNEKGGVLNAHHIFNYSTAKEDRFNVDNGITFCYQCHKEFHSIYTKFNNDEWQVKEFIGDDTRWNLININYSAKEQCP